MTIDYNLQYNKFDVVRELLTNRYMLTTLLVNINNICYYLEGKEKALRELLPEDKRNKIRKSIKFKDSIEFDTFELSNRYFNALSNKFGYEAVTNSCILMDKYIKDNPDKQLSQMQINKRIKEYTTRAKVIIDTKEYIAKAIENANQIDYRLIDNETLARQYIASIPYYLRGVNEGCQYLKGKFDIQ